MCYRPNQTQGHGEIYGRLGGRPHRILVGFRSENVKSWICVFLCSTSSRAQHGPEGSDTLAPVSTVCVPNVVTTHGHGGRDAHSLGIKNKSPPRQRKKSVTITKESGSLLYLFSWPFSLCRSFLPCIILQMNNVQFAPSIFFKCKIKFPPTPPFTQARAAKTYTLRSFLTYVHK